MRKNLFIALAVLTGLVILMTTCDRFEDVELLERKALKENLGLTTVNIAAIQGVKAPVTGGIPVQNKVGNDQYTGTVTWSPNDTTFKGGIKYTATITLKPKDGYTLQMVKANFFTVAGADSVTNSANSGVIKAVFSTMLIDNVWANGTVSSGSEQWFKFTATASTQYIHFTPGSLLSLYVQVYDSNGNEIGSQTLLSSSLSIKYISRTVTSGQTYYISVVTLNGTVGTYQIAFNESTTAPPHLITLNSVTANGSSTQTTTQLTLTFDNAIDGLSASDITLSGVSGISKGTLSGSNPYTLPISDFYSSGTLSVAVAKSGYNINGSPKTVDIYYRTVTLNSVTANGSSTQTTTQLTLIFNNAIDGLSASDITLSGVSGVSKGTLSGSNPYTLPISGFSSGGTLSVAVAKSGYIINGSPKTVGIYYRTVTLNSVTANGSLTQTTTQLTLTFDNAIDGLFASDITLSGVSGVNKGTLSGSNPYTLPISGFTSDGTLNVAVVKSSYIISGSPKTVDIYCYLAVEMIQIPGGSFQMGSNSDTYNEQPVHTVTLSGFYMGKYEVTQEQWLAVMGNNPSNFTSSPASGEVQNKRPVERVSWYDALVFCNKLSMREGLSPAYRISGSTDTAIWGMPWDSKATWDAVEIVAGSTGYRLPTEAQWEYAARGGNGSPGNYTYSGSNTVGDVAWYGSNSGSKTHEVGKKAPNGLGLYDMSGNVWEWCWDWYGDYSSGMQTNPGGAGSGSERVIRGGSWKADNSTRSARRGYQNPSSYDIYDNLNGRDHEGLGFRLVRP